MKLAYVTSTETGAVNRVLADLVTVLTAKGHALAGTTQMDTRRQGSRLCDMDVQVLPIGEVIRISEYRGENARGCRLDADALEQAVTLTLDRLRTADLLIINKFGKHEAEGRGFRDAIATALDRGIPVIVGTNALNIDAFHEFTGGLADPLPADLNSLRTWAEQALPVANAA